MANNYFVNTAPADVAAQYKAQNDAGNGIGIGDDDMTIEDAIRAQGWTVVESYADSLALARDRQNDEYIVGGDGARRNAWAVSAK